MIKILKYRQNPNSNYFKKHPSLFIANSHLHKFILYFLFYNYNYQTHFNITTDSYNVSRMLTGHLYKVLRKTTNHFIILSLIHKLTSAALGYDWNKSMSGYLPKLLILKKQHSLSLENLESYKLMLMRRLKLLFKEPLYQSLRFINVVSIGQMFY